MKTHLRIWTCELDAHLVADQGKERPEGYDSTIGACPRCGAELHLLEAVDIGTPYTPEEVARLIKTADAMGVL